MVVSQLFFGFNCLKIITKIISIVFLFVVVVYLMSTTINVHCFNIERKKECPKWSKVIFVRNIHTFERDESKNKLKIEIKEEKNEFLMYLKVFFVVQINSEFISSSVLKFRRKTECQIWWCYQTGLFERIERAYFIFIYLCGIIFKKYKHKTSVPQVLIILASKLWNLNQKLIIIYDSMILILLFEQEQESREESREE